jgi:hypothetical protein
MSGSLGTAPTGSAFLTADGSQLGTALQELLLSDDIVPGYDPSYQLCKVIYLYHPLGEKIASAPVLLAQSQAREIVVGRAPGDSVAKAFNDTWNALGCSKHILNCRVLSRVYGLSAIALGELNKDPGKPLNFAKLGAAEIYFSVFDPLNTAGSAVMNQDPNAADFLKTVSVSVAGKPYARNRVVIIQNENPVYLSYTSSAFGFVGRSVYQRALFPLKSFVQSMITDDMVTRKAGLLIAKLKPPGSIIDNMMSAIAGVKRALLQQGRTNNVLSIAAPDEDIQSLNLQNIDGAHNAARKNILDNIAAAVPMPAQMLHEETYASGLAEGTEDAKAVARYIDREREAMDPLYKFMDQIVMYRAWTPEFYATLQNEFPEYKDKPFLTAFAEWKNSFEASWPSLLTEPDSEKIKVVDVKLKAVIAVLEVLLPEMDPINKATLIQWVCDSFNDRAFQLLFSNPLLLDVQELQSKYEEDKKQADMQAEAVLMQPGADPKAGEPADKEPAEPAPFKSTT